MKKEQRTAIIPRKRSLTSSVLTLAVTVLAGTLLILAPSASQAHPRGRGMHQPPEEMAAVLGCRLQLTDEQQEAFRSIMEENIDQRRALWQKYRAEAMATRQEHRQEMERFDDDVEARLADVLTGSQMEKFRHIRKERRQWREERRGHRCDFDEKPF